LSAMEAVTHEFALRYLLELSTDIRVALLLDGDGNLTAAAPERPPAQAERAACELAREARALAGESEEAVEVDVTVEGGAVFAVREEATTLVCVTGPFVLPGLILHDMRVVLADLERGAASEGR
jgi:hypothetical protein